MPAVLGKLKLSGQAFGTFDDITIKVASARHESPLLNADLKGEARIADGIALHSTPAPKRPSWPISRAPSNIAPPAEAALGKATVAAKINGTLDDLQVHRRELLPRQRPPEPRLQGQSRN